MLILHLSGYLLLQELFHLQLSIFKPSCIWSLLTPQFPPKSLLLRTLLIIKPISTVPHHSILIIAVNILRDNPPPIKNVVMVVKVEGFIAVYRFINSLSITVLTGRSANVCKVTLWVEQPGMFISCRR